MAKPLYMLFVLILSLSVLADTAYVTDELTVPLRSGPSEQHRIIYAGLPAGTELTILLTDKEAGFTQIKTKRGTEGWIRSDYLTKDPVARNLLSTSESRARTAEQELRLKKLNLESLKAQLVDTEAQADKASNELISSKKELKEIRNISAQALEEHSKNQELKELNRRLRQEVDALLTQYKTTQSNQSRDFLVIGGGLLLVGVLLGVIIKSRPRRSGWS